MISSKTLNLQQLLIAGRFEPASVQREYKWTGQESRVLLDDLLRAFAPAVGEAPTSPPVLTDGEISGATAQDEPDEPDVTVLAPQQEPRAYYLGAIVLLPDGRGGWQIFDGLQRLTTLTILICVLRDCIADRGLKLQLDQLIAVATGGPKRVHRLTLRIGHSLLEKEVLAAGEAAKSRRPRTKPSDTEQRLRSVTHEFFDRIRRWESARAEGFARWLISDTWITVVDTACARTARQIFVSTNVHGVKLDKAELFKGQLFDLADPDTFADITVRWQRLENLIGDELETFLVAVDFLVRREPQSSDCLTQLAAHLAENTRPGNYLAWLEYLEGLAIAFSELVSRMRNPPANHIDTAIWKLGLLPWKEWMPLALRWYRPYLLLSNGGQKLSQATVSALERRLLALHGRCLAMMLARFDQNERFKVFARALQQTDQNRNPLTGALNFNRNQRGKIMRTLLAPILDLEIRGTLVKWIEANDWDRPPMEIKSATVEHVLPTSPASDSRWLEDFSGEDVLFDRTHSLGNLALLDLERQKLALNFDFAIKKGVFGTGFKFKTLEDVRRHSVWTPDVILAREKRLARRVMRVIDLPDEPYPEPARFHRQN